MIIETRGFIIDISNYDIDKLTPYIEQLHKKDRINKFKYDDDKARAIISEILVRTIFCETKSKMSSEIVFDYNRFGKPNIKDSEGFNFNISHSGDLVVGVFDNDEVGVDVEHIKELNIDVARNFCTDNEYSCVLSKDQSCKKQFIISIWTLKEAYIKYLGTGLATSLQSFDVINKENIDPKVNLYSKRVGAYMLGICTKKHINLNQCLEEITVEDLIERYSKYS